MRNSRYRFVIDGRPAGPWRERWKDAAQDAVDSGLAIWKHPGIVLDDTQGAVIERGDEAFRGMKNL